MAAHGQDIGAVASDLMFGTIETLIVKVLLAETAANASIWGEGAH